MMSGNLLAFTIVGGSLSGLIIGSVVIFCFVKGFREAHCLDDVLPGVERRGNSYSMEEIQRRSDLARSRCAGSADTTTKRGRSSKPRSRSASLASTLRRPAERVLTSLQQKSANTSVTQLVGFRRQRSAEDVKIKGQPFYWEAKAMKGKRSGSAPPLRW
ncbi:hypothetical protein DBV05_g8413 [Lasiodiplodia theobromae]|uniref:Uncharacterized protein n=1 Tax=Lasiodiplodia theobromae TaxID=45133 RepID=A0A5N5D5R3_9PEZI|nr:hypothetical protein DBV05_g8413 [Lasiodiplodia theobromae]